MPRRTPKKRTAPEDGAASRPKRHKRGGTHRVKDEHRTGTHWDGKTYEELLYTIKSPSRRVIYTKDMRKHEMARALADHDKERAKGEAAKKREIERKKETKKKAEKEEREKERQLRDKLAGKAERAQRREAGEDVSDSTEAEAEAYVNDIMGIERYGQMVDDDNFWSVSSSEGSETGTPSTVSPTFPHQKLRIYEWPFSDMPSPNSPRTPQTPGGTEREDVFRETLPRKIPYAVMNLVTSTSKETLELPGRTYPEVIRADFVPKLNQRTVDAARNGTMIGPLRKAVVESGKEWAKRTQVQWWNGRMYLNLPERTSHAPPAAETAKRQKGGATARFQDVPKGKKAQKEKKGRRELMLEIYATSEVRPPICYLPAALDHPDLDGGDAEGFEPRTLDSLFYVRFPGMDLPHYYFWRYVDGWKNPTKPNPEWRGVKESDEREERIETLHRQQLFEGDQHRFHIQRGELEDVLRPYPLSKTKKRVKKPNIPRKFRQGKRPKTSKYKAALRDIEAELYLSGVKTTLYKYQSKWRASGKAEHWNYLTEKLLGLFPSGRLPEEPPVHEETDNPRPRSLAEKFACIEVPSPKRPVSPILGDEPWTRDDDVYWDTIDIPPDEMEENAIQRELVPERLRAVEPRVKTQPLDTNTSCYLPRNFEEFDSWLDSWRKDVSPSYAPVDAHMPVSPVEKTFRTFERERWEKVFKQHVEESSSGHRILRSSSKKTMSDTMPNPIAHIEGMPVAELKWQLYSLMNEGLRHDQYCMVCLEPLERSDQKGIYQHYERHRDEADMKCPFCGMKWSILDSQWKASHIYSHDFATSPRSLYCRRSSDRSSQHVSSLRTTSKRNARPSQIVTRPRRASKVKFSPNTVEKRIAYNDRSDTGMDADVSSVTVSPKKSNLKGTTAKGSRKRVLITKEGSTATKSGKGKSNGARKNGRNRERHVSDLTYHEQSTPTDHTPSPPLPLVHRYTADHPNAAYHISPDSDHIPSPYLPHIHRYQDDHPNAAYNPRKWSRTTDESLEYYTGLRPSQKKKSGKAEAPTTRMKAKRKIKGKARVDDQGYDVPSSATSGPFEGLTTEGRKKRKIIDPTYHDRPSPSSSASSTVYHILKIPRGKYKIEDPTYRDRASSRPSASSISSILHAPKRRRVSDPTYRDEHASSNSLGPSPYLVKKKRVVDLDRATCPMILSSSSGVSKASMTTHKSVPSPSSTISNASSSILGRRGTHSPASSASTESNIVVASPKKTTREAPEKVSKPALKKGGSKVEVLVRRRSSIPEIRTLLRQKIGRKGVKPPQERTQETLRDEEDYILLSGTREELGFKDLEEDILTGNPFAPPPKKGKSESNAKATTKGKSKASSTPIGTRKPKTETVKQAAPDAKKRALSLEVEEREKEKKVKTTLSGRLFIEPIPIAPAKRMSGKRTKAPSPLTPTTAATDAGLSMLPTPSPRSTKARTAKVSKISVTKPEKTVKSHSSINMPITEPSPIVPPNTPSVKEGRTSSKAGLAYGSVSHLDAGALSATIESMKTTRGGLVRELPESMKNSVKGKAKGRAVKLKGGESSGSEKERENGKEKVVSGRVVKKVALKAKGETEVKATLNKSAAMAKGRTKAKTTAKTKAASKTSRSKQKCHEDEGNYKRESSPTTPGRKAGKDKK